MSLSNEQLMHVAKLARLQVTPEELPDFAKKINEILAYVEQLQEVDLSDVPEMQHAAGLNNVWREDEVEGCDPDERARCLKAFTASQDDLLEVQAVFDRS